MQNKYLSLIKFSHSIFALPFAIIGYFLTLVEYPDFNYILLSKIILCMVTARATAMAFNRVVDRHYDRLNPRTATREIPAGVITTKNAVIFTITSSVAFVGIAATINTLCLMLSPLALFIVLGYSYTKRFTSLCHIILGIALAIAPSAAYIAVTGQFAIVPLLFSCLVLTWVAGFDIIFALQDVEFDKSQKLYSIPAKLGVKYGLIISGMLHTTTIFFVVMIGCQYINLPLYWVGATIFCSLLVFQHIIVKPTNLTRINLAFGTTNGVASVIYALFTSLSLYLALSVSE